jgi:hypothetical protein
MAEAADPQAACGQYVTFLSHAHALTPFGKTTRLQG